MIVRAHQGTAVTFASLALALVLAAGCTRRNPAYQPDAAPRTDGAITNDADARGETPVEARDGLADRGEAADGVDGIRTDGGDGAEARDAGDANDGNGRDTVADGPAQDHPSDAPSEGGDAADAPPEAAPDAPADMAGEATAGDGDASDQ